MKVKYSFLLLIFLFSLSIKGQIIDEYSSKKPLSIYTFTDFSNSKNNFSAINKKLKLKNLNFMLMDAFDPTQNWFSVDYKDLGKTPTALMYEDYKRYLDRNILNAFLLKNDPTRWNLQCRQPNLQQ
jgi:radical SAM superfamily enzyme YgiQ (UPF0313 family)